MDVMTIATSMLERGFEEVNICKWKQANEDFTDLRRLLQWTTQR